MNFVLALLFLSLSSGALAQVRLTGKSVTPVNDYADPSIPEFLEDGSVRVLSTNGIILTWKTKKSFLKGSTPEISMLKAAHPDGTPFSDELGEDLWDPAFHELDGERVLLAGTMTPPPGQKNARWPDDHWSRRVYLFHEKNGTWIREAKPFISSAPREHTWLNHGYGHEFLEDNGELYVFYERVSEERNHSPWKTEIFMKKVSGQKTAGHEIKVLRIPEPPWKRSLRSFGGSLVEGPRPFKKDGTFYISFSAGDYNSRNYGIHLLHAKTITGPYEPFLDKDDLKDFSSSIQRATPMTWGAGRGTFFNLGSDWWVIYHGTPLRQQEGFRDLFLSPVQISGLLIKISP